MWQKPSCKFIVYLTKIEWFCCYIFKLSFIEVYQKMFMQNHDKMYG